MKSNIAYELQTKEGKLKMMKKWLPPMFFAARDIEKNKIIA
jgi:hypothetical protein